MVLVFLSDLQFEAEKFETRTMPTPNMKGKEMIYWIKVDTVDKRLVSDLQRFLKGASKYIELKVPSAFIIAQTELESYRVSPLHGREEEESAQAENVGEGGESTDGVSTVGDGSFRIEILLRRTLSETTAKTTQSPYG